MRAGEGFARGKVQLLFSCFLMQCLSDVRYRVPDNFNMSTRRDSADDSERVLAIKAKAQQKLAALSDANAQLVAMVQSRDQELKARQRQLQKLSRQAEAASAEASSARADHAHAKQQALTLQDKLALVRASHGAEQELYTVEARLLRSRQRLDVTFARMSPKHSEDRLRQLLLFFWRWADNVGVAYPRRAGRRDQAAIHLSGGAPIEVAHDVVPLTGGGTHVQSATLEDSGAELQRALTRATDAEQAKARAAIEEEQAKAHAAIEAEQAKARAANEAADQAIARAATEAEQAKARAATEAEHAMALAAAEAEQAKAHAVAQMEELMARAAAQAEQAMAARVAATEVAHARAQEEAAAEAATRLCTSVHAAQEEAAARLRHVQEEAATRLAYAAASSTAAHVVEVAILQGLLAAADDDRERMALTASRLAHEIERGEQVLMDTARSWQRARTGEA